MKPMCSKLTTAALALALAGAAAAPALAAPLESAVAAQMQTHRAAAKAQQKIDHIAKETAELLAEYRQVTASLDSFRAYNRQLERLIRSQKQEIASLKRQLARIDVTKRKMVPLMLEMVSVLERFVALDLPFLPKERRNRLDRLHKLMGRSDVALAEKYRRLIQAYRVETEYGRTIGAYRGTLQIEGKPRTVNFLRIGRVALFFQTLDGDTTGRWHVRKARWVVVPDRYREAVAKGLRMARKKVPPDLLVLPIQAPEAANAGQ